MYDRVKDMTDAQVEEEIARLENSPLVKKGRAIENAKYRRREKLYKLRRFERMGLEAAEAESEDPETPPARSVL